MSADSKYEEENVLGADSAGDSALFAIASFATFRNSPITAGGATCRVGSQTR